MIFATNGARFYIGAIEVQKSGDFTASDFSGESWTEAGSLENLGSVGDTANEIAVDIIGEGRTKRMKGTRSAGTMELVFSFNAADAGQAALIAAEKTTHDYAFRLVLNDAPAGGAPSERYFIAIVGGASETFDQANSTVKLNVSLWVNSNVVKVNATGGGA